MISLTLTNVKNTMAHLLLKETFDHFSFIEGEIVTFNTFKFNGYLQKEFFHDEKDREELKESEEYSHWADVRDFCFSLIKGKRTPLSFRFIFSLSPKNIARLTEQSTPGLNPDDVQGLYMNFKFDGTQLTCVTGTSFKSFTMDKTLEHTWDDMVKKFLLKKGIDFEIL